MALGGPIGAQPEGGPSAEDDFIGVVGQLLALTDEEKEALPEDVLTFIDEFVLSPWIPSASVSAVAGYRENLGLSALVPESAAFAEGRVEGFLMWKPDDSPWQALGILDGSYRQYANNPVTDAEQSWFSQAELKWKPWTFLEFRTRGQGFYQDEVADLSTTAAQRTVLPIRVLNGIVDGGVTVRLPGALRLESRYVWRRADYRFVAEDYWGGEWRHGLTWQSASWLGVSYERSDRKRDYDFRQQVTPGGGDQFRAPSCPLPRLRMKLVCGWHGSEVESGDGKPVGPSWKIATKPRVSTTMTARGGAAAFPGSALTTSGRSASSGRMIGSTTSTRRWAPASIRLRGNARTDGFGRKFGGS